MRNPSECTQQKRFVESEHSWATVLANVVQVRYFGAAEAAFRDLLLRLTSLEYSTTLVVKVSSSHCKMSKRKKVKKAKAIQVVQDVRQKRHVEIEA